MFPLIYRYIGTPDFASKVMIGLELSESTINSNDGSVNGRRYFPCKAGHGYFTKPANVTSIAIAVESTFDATNIEKKEEEKQAEITVTVAEESGSGSNEESKDEEDLIIKKRNERFDSTLDGSILWRKVADFSALLPRDVKLKLWNGVFKTESDYSRPEQIRISKMLRTMVMLQLTRV